jgi:hypothetical protein
MVIWSSVEGGLAVAAGNLATLQPLVYWASRYMGLNGVMGSKWTASPLPRSGESPMPGRGTDRNSKHSTANRRNRFSAYPLSDIDADDKNLPVMDGGEGGRRRRQDVEEEADKRSALKVKITQGTTGSYTVRDTTCTVRSESQESLHPYPGGSPDSSVDGTRQGLPVVTTTFQITEERKA